MWRCRDCGFESPEWRTSERFPWCTACEKKHPQHERDLVSGQMGFDFMQNKKLTSGSEGKHQ